MYQPLTVTDWLRVSVFVEAGSSGTAADGLRNRPKLEVAGISKSWPPSPESGKYPVELKSLVPPLLLAQPVKSARTIFAVPVLAGMNEGYELLGVFAVGDSAR